MAEQMNIRVKWQKHIRKGQRGNKIGCPVALAINEACARLRGFRHSRVEEDRIVLYFTNGQVTRDTPEPVARFVRAFDSRTNRRASFEPFEFELEEVGSGWVVNGAY